MKVDYRNPNDRLLFPRYNELALFLMSISFILVFFAYDELQTILDKFFVDRFDLRLFLLLVIFVLGMLLSLYHVFTERRKNDFEKRVMLVFAVFVNAFSGIAAGIHILTDAFDILSADASYIKLVVDSILMLFPIWNMANGVLLLILLRLDIIGEQNITDENATRFQVLLGSLILLLVFLFCYTILKLHWTITFSICVASAADVSGIVQGPFSGSQSD